MNLLCLDTSTNRAVVVVCRRDGAVFEAPGDASARHGRGLVPGVRDLLRTAGLALQDLDGIAVGLGPGSFTGLRVGVMAAKMLAYAATRPVLGLDSLEILARGAAPDASRIAVAVDAQRGDLFTADFHRERPGTPLLRDGPDRLESARDWLARLAPGTLLLGPGLERLKAQIPAGLEGAGAECNTPLGASLAGLAQESWLLGRRSDLWKLEPVYVRPSAAEEKANPNRIRHE
jgi:tRNA threonylcarbamoyladenosine biosynthesis protein TsaB